MRAKITALPNRVTSSGGASWPRMSTVIGPAFTSAAANSEPRRSQPRFGVTSAHDACGPSSVFSFPVSAAITTPTTGESAIVSAYAPMLVTPAIQSAAQLSTRIAPSSPMINPYEPNRAFPEQIPRARCIGAYVARDSSKHQVTTPFPSNKLLLICEESANTTMHSAIKIMTVICKTRLTVGRPPSPMARRCASALLTSCSIGRKKPGINAKAMNHMATIGLKPSWPRAC